MCMWVRLLRGGLYTARYGTTYRFVVVIPPSVDKKNNEACIYMNIHCRFFCTMREGDSGW